MELAVVPFRYLLLDAAGAERDQAPWLDPQAQLLLDLPQSARERLLPAPQVPGRGYIEVARPGVLRCGAALDQQLGTAGVLTGDPAVKTVVPEPPAMRLALPRYLAGRRPTLVEDIKQLIHTD